MVSNIQSDGGSRPGKTVFGRGRMMIFWMSVVAISLLLVAVFVCYFYCNPSEEGRAGAVSADGFPVEKATTTAAAKQTTAAASSTTTVAATPMPQTPAPTTVTPVPPPWTPVHWNPVPVPVAPTTLPAPSTPAPPSQAPTPSPPSTTSTASPPTTTATTTLPAPTVPVPDDKETISLVFDARDITAAQLATLAGNIIRNSTDFRNAVAGDIFAATGIRVDTSTPVFEKGTLQIGVWDAALQASWNNATQPTPFEKKVYQLLSRATTTGGDTSKVLAIFKRTKLVVDSNAPPGAARISLAMPSVQLHEPPQWATTTAAPGPKQQVPLLCFTPERCVLSYLTILLVCFLLVGATAGAYHLHSSDGCSECSCSKEDALMRMPAETNPMNRRYNPHGGYFPEAGQRAHTDYEASLVLPAYEGVWPPAKKSKSNKSGGSRSDAATRVSNTSAVGSTVSSGSYDPARPWRTGASALSLVRRSNQEEDDLGDSASMVSMATSASSAPSLHYNRFTFDDRNSITSSIFGGSTTTK